MNEDVSDKSTRTSSLCWNHCCLQYYMLLSLSWFCFYSSLLFHFSFVWKWHNVKQKEQESERNKMKHIMPIYNYIYHSVCKLLLILSNSNLKNNWEVEGRNLHFILLNNFKKNNLPVASVNDPIIAMLYLQGRKTGLWFQCWWFLAVGQGVTHCSLESTLNYKCNNQLWNRVLRIPQSLNKVFMSCFKYNNTRKGVFCVLFFT